MRGVLGSEMASSACQSFLQSSVSRGSLRGDALSSALREEAVWAAHTLFALRAALVPNTTETWVAAPPAHFRRVWKAG